MGVLVSLSKDSQELLKKLTDSSYRPKLVMDNHKSIDSTQLIAWLNAHIDLEKQTPKEHEFFVASLRAHLLSDLSAALPGPLKKEEEKKGKTSNKIKFAFLAAAGTLVAACEGFDSISTMLTLLNLPALAIVLAGVLFSAVSIAFFYGFDLIQVSQSLGVNLKDAPKLLDVYVLQMQEIKNIRRKISSYSLTKSSVKELAQYEMMMLMLEERLSALKVTSKQFDVALHSKKIKIAKFVFAGFAGLLYFGSGFFAAQSVAVYLLGLVVTSVSPAFWPVILFSIVVGLAALALYWYVERPSLKKLVSGWFGLDEEKVELLCDQSKLEKEAAKLGVIKENIKGITQLKLEAQIAKSPHADNEELANEIAPSPEHNVPSAPKSSSNIYFFQPIADGSSQQDSIEERVSCTI